MRYKAKENLYVGWALAHAEGDEFEATAEAVRENGWTSGTEKAGGGDSASK